MRSEDAEPRHEREPGALNVDATAASGAVASLAVHPAATIAMLPGVFGVDVIAKALRR